MLSQELEAIRTILHLGLMGNRKDPGIHTESSIELLFCGVAGNGVASNPGFPFRILSRSFGEKSPKLQDKIRNGKPGFEARNGVRVCCHVD